MATFLRNLVSRIRQGDGSISVAAFGKHPAWGDHLPDIGLVGRLVEARQSLYLDGIRDKAISYWKSTDESQLIPFEHDLLWQKPDALIVGRLWASADGATPPRRDFPMVLLADCTGLPLAWALKKVLPRLAKAEAACKATVSGDQVRAAVLSAEDDLRKLVAQQRPSEASSGGMPPKAAVIEIARLPDFGPEHRGLMRIFHVLADVNPNVQSEYPRAEQVRVPRAFVPSAAALELWRKFMVARFGEKIETLLLVPRAQDWVDVLVGKPDAVQFNVLRASPQLIPCTTDIGYTLSPGFQAETEKFLADCGFTADSEHHAVDPALLPSELPSSPEEVAAAVESPALDSVPEPAEPEAPSTAARDASPPMPEPTAIDSAAERLPAGFGDEVTRKIVLPHATPRPTPRVTPPVTPPAERVPPKPTPPTEPAPVSFGDEVTRKIVLPPATPRPTPRATVVHEEPPSKPPPPVEARPEPEPSPPPRPPITEPVKKRSKALWITAAVVLVALGGLLVMLPKLLKPQQLAENDWASLCTEYSTWFSDFEESLQDPARVKRYSTDAEVKKAIDRVITAKAGGAPIDPRVILSRPGMSYAALAEKAVEKPLPEDVVAKGKRANEIVSETKRAFTGEQWPLLHRAQELRKRFGENTTAAGKALGLIIDSISTGPNSCLTDGLDRMVEIAPAIEKISHCLATLALDGPSLEQSGDPSLKAFVRDANSDLDTAAKRGFPELAAESQALDQQVTEIAAVLKSDWPNSIARDQFLKRPAATSQPATLAERLKGWRDDVAKYRRLPAAGSLRDAAEQDRKALAAIETELGAMKRDGSVPVDQLTEELTEARKATELFAAPDLVEKDRPALEGAAQKSHQLLAALQENLRAAKAMAGKGEKKLRDELIDMREVVSNSAALNAAWQSERDALLAQHISGLELARKTTALQARLRELNGEMTRPFTELPPLPQREWATSLREKAGFAERDRLIAAAIADGGWQGEKRTPEFDSRWNKATGSWAAWQTQASALATDAATIEDRIDQLYPLDAAPKTGDKPARELYKTFSASPLLQNQKLSSAFWPVISRVAAMLDVEAEPARLVARGGTPPVEVLLAAWSKAADLSVKDGRALESALLSALANVKAPRAAEVATEVRREAAGRWAKHLVGSDAAQINDACKAYLEDKPAEGEPSLEPRARYNLALYTLKHGQLKDDETARTAAAGLDKTIGEIAPLAADPVVVSLRQKLADVQAPSAAATSGPPLAGWTLVGEEKVGSELIATFEWKKADAGHAAPRLKFAKVPGDGKVASFYLGTTEVSYRQFSDIIGAGGNWDLLGGLLPHDQRRLGPKLWSFQNGINMNPSWSYPGNLVQDSYPPSLAASTSEGARGVPNLLQGGSVTNPSQNHPMQYVNPAAAIYVAGVVGCRLPLASEWKLAYQRFEVAPGTNQPRSIPNVRDATWLKQYEWLKEKGNARLALSDVFSPGAEFLAGKDAFEADAKTDDGFLYFAPVEGDTGRVVHHLAGNVAEMVIGGDRPPQAAQVRTDKDVTDYLAALTTDAGRGVMVIGGSALSHPRQPIDQPFPLPSKGSAPSYCDVGFRLAFSAPQASAQAKLAAAVEAAPYLLAIAGGK